MPRQSIDRAAFLFARMAYLARLREDGEREEDMMRACNLGAVGQVRLLLMAWDTAVPLPGEERATREAAIRAEERERCAQELDNLGYVEAVRLLRGCLDAEV